MDDNDIFTPDFRGLTAEELTAAQKQKAETVNLPRSLGGELVRELSLEEARRLNALNEKYIQTVVSGKNVIVEIGTTLIGGHPTRVCKYIRPSEFDGRFTDEPPVYGQVMKTGAHGVKFPVEGKPISIGKAWLAWPGKVKKLGGIDFFPAPEYCPDDVYNLFDGYELKGVKGDVEPWLDLVERVICAGNKDHARIVVGFFAHMLQKPWEKPGFALWLCGGRGTGKGSLLEPFKEIIGKYYAHVLGMQKISGRFNSIAIAKLLILVDEAHVTNRQDEDAAKGLITESSLVTERKGYDAEQASNFTRVVFATNRLDAIRTGEEERRYFQLEVSRVHQQDRKYFAAFRKWLKAGGAAHLMQYLENYDISDFDPHFVPRTTTLQAEMIKGLSPFLAYLHWELNQPRPFNLRGEIKQWEDLQKKAIPLPNILPGNIEETPIFAGGALCSYVNNRCAQWLNENRPQTGGAKYQANSVTHTLGEMMKPLGFYKKKPSSSWSWYFDDLHQARRLFAESIGVDYEVAFPEI